jgi:hypothetical protein
MSATPQRCYDTGVWLVAPMLQASLSPATSPGTASPASSSSWNSLALWAASGVLLLLVVVLLVCPVAVALSGQ